MAKTMIGKVVSNKMDKTVVVAVESSKTHPLYRKQYTRTARFKAHDAENKAQVGDLVEITETRPISAQKRFTISKTLEAAPVAVEETTGDAV